MRSTPHVRGPRATLAGLAALLLALTACGDNGGSAGDGLEGELTVYAAASLTDAFEEVAEAFVAEHPDVEITFSLAGSQTLATQINEGAPADVFASANTTQMDVVADAGNLDGEPAIFASNLLAIVVEAGNPFGIATLEDLANPELTLVLPDEAVPAGQYARQALDAAEVTVTPSSLEQDVRAALSRVELGEADASIVYRTDLVSASDTVEGVEIPDDQNVPADYPIATLAEAPNPAAGEAFVAFVLGEHGRRILEEHGFTTP